MFRIVQMFSYWLGAAFGALALLARALDTAGKNFLDFATRGSEVTYHTYTDAMYFFFAVAIATAVCTERRHQNVAKRSSILDVSRAR